MTGTEAEAVQDDGSPRASEAPFSIAPDYQPFIGLLNLSCSLPFGL